MRYLKVQQHKTDGCERTPTRHCSGKDEERRKRPQNASGKHHPVRDRQHEAAPRTRRNHTQRPEEGKKPTEPQKTEAESATRARGKAPDKQGTATQTGQPGKAPERGETPPSETASTRRPSTTPPPQEEKTREGNSAPGTSRNAPPRRPPTAGRNHAQEHEDTLKMTEGPRNRRGSAEEEPPREGPMREPAGKGERAGARSANEPEPHRTGGPRTQEKEERQRDTESQERKI
ncbi:hypothetical protein ACROYT_G043526 [Oculina patagonica]